MMTKKVTITINTFHNGNFAFPYPKSKPKSKLVSGCSVDAVEPLVDEAFERTMEEVINKVAVLHGELPEPHPVLTEVQHSHLPIRSPVPALPIPPRFKINKAWKKVPPAPKLTVSTESETTKLTWTDGISLGSYYLYANIAEYELYVCVMERGADETKWEKLTSVQALPLRYNQRCPVILKITGMTRGIEYYLAVRTMDVHDRRGPFAFKYVKF